MALGYQSLSNGPVFEWGSEKQTEKSLFRVQNVLYSNGPPNYVTFPLEYQTTILSSIQMNPVFRCLYSDGYCIYMLVKVLVSVS